MTGRDLVDHDYKRPCDRETSKIEATRDNVTSARIEELSLTFLLEPRPHVIIILLSEKFKSAVKASNSSDTNLYPPKLHKQK